MSEFSEDAGCAYPCGGEPMECPTCPERGRTTKPKTGDDYREMFRTMSDEEIEAYCIAEDEAERGY